MPTTTTGTAYTVRTVEIPGHGTCVWGVADGRRTDPGIPSVLYAHGAGGAADQFATLGAWTGLRDWLIDNGWAWIEGTGGGPQSWGNVAAQEAYTAYLEHVEGVLDLAEVVLLGRSMGGLVTAWLCARSPIASRFSGWINNSGVSTLFAGTVSAPSVPDRPSGQYFSSGTYPAYGISSYAGLQSAAADHAPESWPASVWDGKRILSLYGDADTTVPWSPRGAALLRQAWSGRPLVDEVALRPGGDHTGTNGSYLDVTAMASFLGEIVGDPPLPDPEPSVLRILEEYVVIGGRLHEMSATG